MASRVLYKNITYDVIANITLIGKNYVVLLDINDLNNIVFLEKIFKDDNPKYILPPKSFNSAYDIKNQEASFIVSRIVEILKCDINSGKISSQKDIEEEITEIKNFLDNDMNIKLILNDTKDLNAEEFKETLTCLEDYLNRRFLFSVKNNDPQQYTYLDRPIKTNGDLNYEWLYALDSYQLKDIIRNKNLTSDELLYIMDALEKSVDRENSIKQYIKRGKLMAQQRQERVMAFVDVMLLILITVSFGLLLLLSIF